MLELIAAVATVLLIVFASGYWTRRDERALVADYVSKMKSEYGREWAKSGSCQQNRIEGYWLACDTVLEQLGGLSSAPMRDPVHERRKAAARRAPGAGDCR